MIRLALLLALWAASVQAQDAASVAEAARAQLDQAQQQLAAAQSASDRIAALTDVVQAYEQGLEALRDGMRRAALREDVLARDLAAKSDDVAQLLGVLQTMGRAPTPLLLLHPSGPVGTARGGMILSDVTPGLQAEVDALAAQLSEAERLRYVQGSAATTLQQGLDGAATARAALAAAVAERRDLPRRYDEDPVQTALMVASADTLAAFARMLSTVEANGALPRSQSVPRDMPLPVAGVVLRRYNERDASGTARPGVVIATRPRALVTVPVPATLRFKGSLLDYGSVAILEPAADMLIVFAGMEEIFGAQGEVLPAGSPLGLMGGQPPSDQGNVTPDRGEIRSESLYIEVRTGEETSDPAQWFLLE